MKTGKTFSAAIVFLGVVLVLGVGAFGRGLGLEEPGASKARGARQEGAAREHNARFAVEVAELARDAGLGVGVVKGAPFSAQATTETTQTLANGAHITQKQTGGIYRDSEGRVRHELPRNGEPEIVLISDPAQGVIYHLHMFRHTTVKVALATEGQAENPEVAAKLKAERRAANPAEPTPGQLAEDKQLRRQRRTESLGSQTVEGVQAEGTRITLTIPAGSEGNDQPFDIVSERWYSPELRIVVMTRHSDPRTGDVVHKLTNINRTEPPQSLFEPPPGFTVTEEKR